MERYVWIFQRKVSNETPTPKFVVQFFSFFIKKLPHVKSDTPFTLFETPCIITNKQTNKQTKAIMAAPNEKAIGYRITSRKPTNLGVIVVIGSFLYGSRFRA